MTILIIFSSIILIIGLMIFLLLTKNNSETTNITLKTNTISIFKRTVLIYSATIILGSIITAILASGSRYNWGYENIPDIINEFIMTFFVFVMYSFIFSVLPGFILLFITQYLSLKKLVTAERKKINIFSGLIISAVVLILNYFLLKTIIWHEIPYIISGILSSYFIPLFLGDYKITESSLIHKS